jgi:hypothetical protein
MDHFFILSILLILSILRGVSGEIDQIVGKLGPGMTLYCHE